MTELGGLVWLVAGLLALCVAAGLVACCLRIRSLVEFVLAAYILAWSWIVLVAYALSPAHQLTREGLSVGIGAGLTAALAAWLACGTPEPPMLGPPLERARIAVRRPAVLVLAIAVSVGAVYSAALAVFTPANDWDALGYHVARAALWKQEHGLGYVTNAPDLRLSVNPPNAEIGQLGTMLLSGSDRYVAVPQLVAYGVLVLCAAGLARRIGLGASEAVFGALAFATLPIVVVQASGALNDLVVASFLATAVLFALTAGRASLVLFALAIGLAIGTKFTAIVALPTLALVVVFDRSPRRWLAHSVAGLGGLVVGSSWYVVNVVETGSLDGGLADAADQRAETALPAVIVSVQQFALGMVDLSGAAAPHFALFLVPVAVLVALGLVRRRRSDRENAAFLTAAVLTASTLLLPLLWETGKRVVLETGALLGGEDSVRLEESWRFNAIADPTLSWYGPLGLLLVLVGTVSVAVLCVRRTLPRVALALALAPWVLLLTFAVTIAWDPWRGRFLVFGFALAAATWGVPLLRSRATAWATTAIGTTALILSLANYQGKPSGLGELWALDAPPGVSTRSIWGERRADAQARLRPREGEKFVYRYFEEEVPEDASVALALRGDDFISPYFGDRLSRHISLVHERSDGVPGRADWLVLSPSSKVRRCLDAWRRELTLTSGWRIERRIGPEPSSSPAPGSGPDRQCEPLG